MKRPNEYCVWTCQRRNSGIVCGVFSNWSVCNFISSYFTQARQTWRNLHSMGREHKSTSWSHIQYIFHDLLYHTSKYCWVSLSELIKNFKTNYLCGWSDVSKGVMQHAQTAPPEMLNFLSRKVTNYVEVCTIQTTESAWKLTEVFSSISLGFPQQENLHFWWCRQTS